MKTSVNNIWFAHLTISGATSLAAATPTTRHHHRGLDLAEDASKASKSKALKDYQSDNIIDGLPLASKSAKVFTTTKASKAKTGKSHHATKSGKTPKDRGWAPNNSFYGTYKTDFNVTFIAEIGSITISYECLDAYKDLPPYEYIVLPLVTQTLSTQLTSENGFTAITYDNSTNTPNREYARFDFVTEEETQVLYYCEGDYKEDSIEDAIEDDMANPYNLTAGCNGYPWSKLFPNDGTC